MTQSRFYHFIVCFILLICWPINSHNIDVSPNFLTSELGRYVCRKACWLLTILIVIVTIMLVFHHFPVFVFVKVGTKTGSTFKESLSFFGHGWNQHGVDWRHKEIGSFTKTEWTARTFLLFDRQTYCSNKGMKWRIVWFIIHSLGVVVWNLDVFYYTLAII